MKYIILSLLLGLIITEHIYQPKYTGLKYEVSCIDKDSFCVWIYGDKEYTMQCGKDIGVNPMLYTDTLYRIGSRRYSFSFRGCYK